MRLTIKSTAIAVFIGGCTAAGVVVASASTPTAHDSPSSSQVEPAESGSPVSTEAQHHGRTAHQGVNRGRGDDSAAPTSVPASEPGDDSDDATEPSDDATEPSDDNDQGEDNNDQGEDRDDQGVSDESSDPGDDNDQGASDASGDDDDQGASTEPGDDDGDSGDN
jgi:hypothetical protein